MSYLSASEHLHHLKEQVWAIAQDNSQATIASCVCSDEATSQKCTWGEHIYLKRRAALKVLHASLEDEDVDQFLSEAQRVRTS